ncbi:hypothetical protein [Streptomyces viridosporus]|uniref:hypothetical protein n=1 Tax=Streptomyces viridosporus TaxID=67581 RepID=UPI003701CDCC
MANDPNFEPEVLHHRGVLTPFQEWHNEPRRGGVPRHAPQRPKLAETDRFEGRKRATQVVHQQRQEFYENLTPGREPTCGLGEPKRVIICTCKRGEHE